MVYSHNLLPEIGCSPPGRQVFVFPCMQLAVREAAMEIWDSVVVESANSLINFRLYCEEDDGQAGASAQ